MYMVAATIEPLTIESVVLEQTMQTPITLLHSSLNWFSIVCHTAIVVEVIPKLNKLTC